MSVADWRLMAHCHREGAGGDYTEVIPAPYTVLQQGDD